MGLNLACALCLHCRPVISQRCVCIHISDLSVTSNNLYITFNGHKYSTLRNARFMVIKKKEEKTAGTWKQLHAEIKVIITWTWASGKRAVVADMKSTWQPTNILDTRLVAYVRPLTSCGGERKKKGNGPKLQHGLGHIWGVRVTQLLWMLWLVKKGAEVAIFSCTCTQWPACVKPAVRKS